jgi:hypothetical protein
MTETKSFKPSRLAACQSRPSGKSLSVVHVPLVS